MTYRERRARRADRLRGWAEKRAQRSAAAFTSARRILDGIPPGQPILVGHHSEKHHRRDLARVDAGLRRGIEHEAKAGEMASRAAEIDRQAEHAIYRDDPDAIERLRERLAALEAERARVKVVNTAIRRHGLIRLLQADPPFELTPPERAELARTMQLCPYHQVETRGWPAYHLANLSGNISRQRKRLTDLEAAAAQRARVRAVLDAERAATDDEAPGDPS